MSKVSDDMQKLLDLIDLDSRKRLYDVAREQARMLAMFPIENDVEVRVIEVIGVKGAVMDDEEVAKWLNEKERVTWAVAKAMVDDHAGVHAVEVDRMAFGTTAALRTLAETRKALAACEDRSDLRCPLCSLGPQGNHDETCIFATMPRPR